MKECLVKEVSRDVMYLELFTIQLHVNVNKLHVSLLHESSIIHCTRFTSPSNIMAVIKVTERDILLRFASTAVVQFYAKRNFYYSDK